MRYPSCSDEEIWARGQPVRLIFRDMEQEPRPMEEQIFFEEYVFTFGHGWDELDEWTWTEPLGSDFD